MNKEKFRSWIKKEVVFIGAALLAITSSFFTGVHSSHIDFDVLMLLFNLMLVVVAFEKLQVLDYLSTLILKHCQNTRQLMVGLIALTFFMAMIITNDVALITFVPLAL
ncbi:MAG TPA: anion transporter, partial [Firmicutes bacterium]|nr:anion transporter [Bacillota bacterium]